MLRTAGTKERPFVNQSCACRCGQSVFTVRGKPLARFLCHCQICQSIYKQPFADVVVCWASAISLPRDHAIRFKRYRLPPAVRRGTCSSCGAPVVSFMRLAPFAKLGFVPAMNCPDSAAMPPPSAHIFYHRRVHDADDSLPKYSGYWASELATTKLIVGNIVSR